MEEKLLRKLGTGEAMFNAETKRRAMIMVSSTLFTSNVDLFDHLPKIDQAIQALKSVHPLLRCKVVDKLNADGEPEWYFAFASEEKIAGLDNVTYLRLETNVNVNDYWRLIHDRALNLEPVNSDTGLMWRLILVRLTASDYCLVLTLNHAISDGSNSIAVVDQLLGFIDQLIDNNPLDWSKIVRFDMNPPMDEVVLKRAASIQFDPTKAMKFKIESKIPTNLEPKSARAAPDNLPVEDRFVDVRTNEILPVKELIIADSREYFTKLRPLPVDQATLASLLAKCKSVDAKLTGCLTVISSLAVRDLYTKWSCGEHADKVDITMLVNFRPTENIGNLNMGCWAHFLEVILDLKGLDQDADDFYAAKFWQMCKHESDSLHGRIKNNEMLHTMLGFAEMGKNKEMVKAWAEMKPPRGGGVHFSLSNKGVYNPAAKMNHLNISHCFSNTSCPEDRFAAVLFLGMYSINKQLSWSIGYNPNLISDDAIEYLANSINRIIQRAIKS